MSKNLRKIRNDFMDVIGFISVDELALNQKAVQLIREIYEELSDEKETFYDQR